MKKSKRLEYEERQVRELDEDIYSQETLNDLVEWDEISDEEAAFMTGYMEA